MHLLSCIGQSLRYLPALPLCGSVSGEEVREGTVLLPGFWKFAQHFPVISPTSPCAAGALLSVARVVVPRMGGFVYILEPCGPFKWALLRDPQFLLLAQPLLVFTARNYEALLTHCWNPGLHRLACGWDCSDIFYASQFLSTPHEFGTAWSAGFHHHHLAMPLHPGSPSPPFLSV